MQKLFSLVDFCVFFKIASYVWTTYETMNIVLSTCMHELTTIGTMVDVEVIANGA